jgi:dihydrofolate reductase
VRKLVVSEFISLDGVVEEPSWTFQFGSEDRDKYKFDELAAADALLLGRVTYEGFAAAWPRMEEQTGEYGTWMNGYPKHVASRTLEEPLRWNNSTLIEGDLAEGVSRLKERDGKDILVFGSADLVGTLMEHDLVDEYRLMVFPVVVGKGKRLFGDTEEMKPLRLVDTKPVGPDGVIVLTYEPARGEEAGA